MLECNLPVILDSMQQYGFAILNNLPSGLLTALQAEAAAALEQAEAAACADGGASIQDIARQMGCIFQVLPELHLGHAARSSSNYWQHRSLWPCQQAAAAFLQSQQLLSVLQEVLGSRTVLLYNEQYIIKPPNIHSASAFGWHYDSQYATSSGRAVAHSPYLSLWVALDDVDQENGCLVVIPGGRVDACGCVRPDCKGMVYIPASTPQECFDAITSLQQQQECLMWDSMQPALLSYQQTGHNEQQQQQPREQQQVQKQQQPQQPQQQQQLQLQLPMGQAAPSHLDPRTCASIPAAAESHDHRAAAAPSTGAGAAAAAGAAVSDIEGHSPPAVGLLMPAGTAVLFWDDLWHCSGPNSSNYTRSAYMAQFSSQPLVWQDSGGLVGLAVHLSALW